MIIAEQPNSHREFYILPTKKIISLVLGYLWDMKLYWMIPVFGAVVLFGALITFGAIKGANPFNYNLF